jgi:DNA ligase-associated metallophosphoesterase
MLLLRPDRSAYWPGQNALLVADVHLGKAEHFRRNGFAVPAGVHEATMNRLNAALAETGATTLMVLGDLFHSERNAEWDAFIAWRAEAIQLQRVMLIQGNHDLLSDQDWRDAGVESFERWDGEGLTLTHDPDDWQSDFGVHLCGHVHPGIRLKGRGKQSLRVACWWRKGAGTQKEQVVFPAFGEFTGKHAVQPDPADEFYLLAGDQVLLKKA